MTIFNIENLQSKNIENAKQVLNAIKNLEVSNCQIQASVNVVKGVEKDVCDFIKQNNITPGLYIAVLNDAFILRSISISALMDFSARYKKYSFGVEIDWFLQNLFHKNILSKNLNIETSARMQVFASCFEGQSTFVQMGYFVRQISKMNEKSGVDFIKIGKSSAHFINLKTQDLNSIKISKLQSKGFNKFNILL